MNIPRIRLCPHAASWILPEAEPMDAMLLTTETEEDKKKRTPRKIRIDGMKV